jgi:hypothetical protein
MRHRQSIDIMRLAGEVVHNLRSSRRDLVGLPASVRTIATDADPVEHAYSLVLEELGPTGARLIGNVPIAPGTEIHFEVPGSALAANGIVRHVQAHETAVAVLFSIGVELSGARKRTTRWLPNLIPTALLTKGKSDEQGARAA